MKWWNHPRIAVRRDGMPDPRGRCVVYWMQRAQRALDNPALEVAIRAANELGRPVVVFFALLTTHRIANLRHYTFMIEGLVDTARRLERRGIGLVVRVSGDPVADFLRFCVEVRPAIAVTDENPLRHSARWREAAARSIAVPLLSVDADVMVPTALLRREQYAARTIRPRIHAVLEEHLKPVGNRSVVTRWHPDRKIVSLPVSMDLLRKVRVDGSVSPVRWIRGGTSEALRALKTFAGTRLNGYAAARNHPEVDAHQPPVSLSPLRPHRAAHGGAGGAASRGAARAIARRSWRR